MRIRTKKFLQEKFKEYYLSTQLEFPPRYEEREWGIILLDTNFPEKTVMNRHKSFSTKSEAKNYFESMVPAHVYFSSAYYDRPNARKMEEKGWKSADLIFDLDADHLEGVEELSYPQMLEKVKNETKHLVSDFLLDDFGFDEKSLEIVFSGGRGYHVHVRDDKVMDLNSQQRREIIDYLFGEGLEPIITEKKEKKTYVKYFSDDKTWTRKIKRWILDEYFPKLVKLSEKESISELTRFKGVGEKKAEKIISFLKKEDYIQRIKEESRLEIVKGVSKGFWNQLIEMARNKVNAEADEPVTSDVKRLIRLPTSLHAGTGFRVKPIELNELEDFDPFEDAVVFGEDLVKVYAKNNYSISLVGEEIKVEKGEIKKIPSYGAIFLGCLGVVEVEGW